MLVVGGAGYIGSVLTRRLLEGGRRVRVLDSLLYGNGEALADVAEHDRFAFARGDVRSAEDVEAALAGVADVVLLAALVGDPVCKRNPDLARETNLEGARNLIGACSEAGVERFVFASTCSNYGLRGDDTPAAEDDELHPLSLYAETKVEMERALLGAGDALPFTPTVLRVSTAFGLSPRMRFDLTVSEFTRELALGRSLEVYDADTWRPYCHVDDISTAITKVLGADPATVGGEVFNVGGDDSNHTKRDIVETALRAVSADGGRTGEITWTEGGADPRNYRVSFAKIQDRLGFFPSHTVAGSIERLVTMIRAGAYTDIGSRPLYFGNLHLDARTLAGEGSGGGDAG